MLLLKRIPAFSTATQQSSCWHECSYRLILCNVSTYLTTSYYRHAILVYIHILLHWLHLLTYLITPSSSIYFTFTEGIYDPFSVSGPAVCDVIIPRSNRKQQFPQATAHIPPPRLVPLVVPAAREHPVQRHPKPVRLPGLRRPGLRVSRCGPDAGRLVPPRQGGRSLLFPGAAPKERQPGPGRLDSGTVRQPPPTAAGRAAFPPRRYLPATTQPVSLPVRRTRRVDQMKTETRDEHTLITGICD